MVMNNTNTVATIIHAVLPESSVAAAFAGAAASTTADEVSAGASWAVKVSTGNRVTANTKSTLESAPNNVFFFMLINGYRGLTISFSSGYTTHPLSSIQLAKHHTGPSAA
mgnify:CR=1 FL=1